MPPTPPSFVIKKECVRHVYATFRKCHYRTNSQLPSHRTTIERSSHCANKWSNDRENGRSGPVHSTNNYWLHSKSINWISCGPDQTSTQLPKRLLRHLAFGRQEIGAHLSPCQLGSHVNWGMRNFVSLINNCISRYPHQEKQVICHPPSATFVYGSVVLKEISLRLARLNPFCIYAVWSHKF